MNSARFFKRTFPILLMVALIAACSGPAATPKAPLRVEYTNWWGDYTMIIADKKGFFEKYNVEVKPVYYEVFSLALPDLASAQLDAGTLTLGDTLNVNTHTNLTAVALSDDGGASVVASRPEIQKITDLKGKKIGINIGSAYELMVDEMLASANLKTSDVEFVDTDPENVPQALQDNTIQAGFTWEPYSTQARGQGDHILYSSEQTSGLFANAIVFRSDLVAQRPEDVRNYLKAWFEAVQFRIANPDEANHLISFTLNIPLEEVAGDAKLLSMSENLNIYTQKPTGNVISVYSLAQLNADFLMRNGSLTRIPSILQLFDPSFLSK